jgi:hypothetical protein
MSVLPRAFVLSRKSRTFFGYLSGGQVSYTNNVASEFDALYEIVKSYTKKRCQKNAGKRKKREKKKK